MVFLYFIILKYFCILHSIEINITLNLSVSVLSHVLISVFISQFWRERERGRERGFFFSFFICVAHGNARGWPAGTTDESPRAEPTDGGREESDATRRARARFGLNE